MAPGNLYASVAHGILIRAALAHSVQKGWGAGVTDIPPCSLAETSWCPGGDCAPKSLKSAILLSGGGSIMPCMGSLQARSAGRCTGIKPWAGHMENGGLWFFLQKNWRREPLEIMKHGHTGTGPTCEGHVIAYVDDIMALANDNLRTSFFDPGRKR